MRFLIIGLVLLLVGCSGASTTKEASGTVAYTPAEPVVLTWSGNGVKNTETFTITNSPFTVSYSFMPDYMANLFSITVTNVNGGESHLIANIVNNTSEKSDMSYVYDKGTFYLEIMAVSGSYNISVVGN